MKTNFNCQDGRKVRIKSKAKIHFIEMSQITHIICEGYLSRIYSLNFDIINVSKLLKSFEEELSEFGFVRANRSTLVNLYHVKEYISGSNRTLVLVNDTKINISRRRVFLFRNY